MNGIHIDSPVEAGVPAIIDDQEPATTVRPRRRTTLVVLFGVLVLALCTAVLATVHGSSGPPQTATPGPGAATNGAPANPPATVLPLATGAAASATTAAASPTAAGPPTHYVRLRLPDLSSIVDPRPNSSAAALNDRGQAVGQSLASNGRVHPVLWRDGRVTDLGVLQPGPNEMGIALDINTQGDVVGGSAGPDGQHAVLWRDGDVIDLGTLDGHGSFANAINDRGQIVGRSYTATGAIKGFIWRTVRCVTWASTRG